MTENSEYIFVNKIFSQTQIGVPVIWPGLDEIGNLVILINSNFTASILLRIERKQVNVDLIDSARESRAFSIEQSLCSEFCCILSI